MGYQVQVKFAPVFELFMSLEAYKNRSMKVLELRDKWGGDFRHQLPPDFAALCQGIDEAIKFPVHLLLAMHSPAPDFAGFSRWVAALTPGELYELLASHIPEGGPALPAGIGAMRDQFLTVLSIWERAYFQGVDAGLLDGLAKDEQEKQVMAQRLAPEAAVEVVTGGLVLEPGPQIQKVVLVPQFHMRPLNITSWFRDFALILYPADVVPPAPDEPLPALGRLTAAVAEAKRLRILKFLAAAPRTFTEVVAFAGLAKSTVHYHLVALRAAGLMRVHMNESSPDRYSFRPAGLAELGARLNAYLKGE